MEDLTTPEIDVLRNMIAKKYRQAITGWDIPEALKTQFVRESTEEIMYFVSLQTGYNTEAYDLILQEVDSEAPYKAGLYAKGWKHSGWDKKVEVIFDITKKDN